MSSYSFIATDYEIPEIDNRNGNSITVKEAIGFSQNSENKIWKFKGRYKEVEIGAGYRFNYMAFSNYFYIS